MKKYHLAGLLGAALCVTLSACSTTRTATTPNQLAQKTVNYECHAPGQRSVNLEVQYTFQGSDPVTAQIIYDDQAIALTRTTDSKVNMVGNTFAGNGYTWTTGQFTVVNAAQVDGDMLTRADTTASGGAPVNTIIARNCKVKG